MGTKANGTGLYMEFRSPDKKTTQYIIAPEAVSPTTGTIVPARLLYRQIDQKNPQKGWRTKVANDHGELDGIGGIKKVADQTTALRNSIELMAFAAGYLVQMGMGDWKLFKMPLAIQTSTEDTATFERAETPKALIRRVNAARTAAGFPKSAIEE